MLWREPAHTRERRTPMIMQSFNRVSVRGGPGPFEKDMRFSRECRNLRRLQSTNPPWLVGLAPIVEHLSVIDLT